MYDLLSYITACFSLHTYMLMISTYFRDKTYLIVCHYYYHYYYHHHHHHQYIHTSNYPPKLYGRPIQNWFIRPIITVTATNVDNKHSHDTFHLPHCQVLSNQKSGCLFVTPRLKILCQRFKRVRGEYEEMQRDVVLQAVTVKQMIGNI